MDKNILAYFNTPEQAQQVAAKLSSLKLESISIDRFSRYPGEGSNESILNSTMDSLSSATLHGSFTSASSGILAAADPSASGMSDGGAGVRQARTFCSLSLWMNPCIMRRCGLLRNPVVLFNSVIREENGMSSNRRKDRVLKNQRRSVSLLQQKMRMLNSAVQRLIKRI